MYNVSVKSASVKRFKNRTQIQSDNSYEFCMFLIISDLFGWRA